MARILGFEVFDNSIDKFLNKVYEKYENGERTVIISGNPETLYTAYKNDELKALLNESEIIPDGVGVIIAGKLTNQRFKEKIAGIDVFFEILRSSGKKNARIYMLGAQSSILEEAVANAKSKYAANISGFHDGYFDLEDCEQIVDDINNSNADILIVAMGCPRQEFFISRYKNKLKCKIFMGVGGSFDVLAGKVSRAPEWMINLGLEWLYRVFKEPKRILRLFSIPKFLSLVIMNRNKV